MKVRAVIPLDLLPASVYYRRYFHGLNQSTALHRCVSELAELIDDVAVIAFDEADYQRCRALLADGSFTLHLSRESLELPALLDLPNDGHQHVLVFRLECLLTPPELARFVIESHLRDGHGMTWVKGLPTTMTPVAFDLEFIKRLLALGLPDIASSSPTTVDVLTRLGADQVGDALGMTAVALDAERLYGRCPIPLARASVAYCQDVERLLRIMEESADDSRRSQKWARLRTWHAVTVAHKEADAAQFIRASNTSGAAACREVPRVLYVSHASGYSGAEESLLQLVRHLPGEAYEKHALVALDGELTDRLRRADVTVTCPQRPFLESTLQNALYVTGLLREVRPDILHLNGLDGLPVLTAGIMLGIPIVLHVRNGAFAQYEDYARAADRLIAVSQFVKDGVAPLVSDASRIAVIYDEVDPDLFRPDVYSKADARQKLGLSDAAFVVGMIARFASNKRHDIMIDAVARARSRIPHLGLVLKGEIFEHPEVFAAAQARIAARGLQACVTWIPFVDDIRTVHAAVDALVLCSDNEGLGRCVVEAMAMERPVIVTRGGGSHEIVRHRHTGLVVDAGDVTALADALVELATHPDDVLHYGRRGREFVLDNLTAAASARRVTSIYRALMAH